MPIGSAGGEATGTVRAVVADSRGRVQSLLVDMKGRTASIPAANFSGRGNILVSAMSAGEINRTAGKQSSVAPMKSEGDEG